MATKIKKQRRKSRDAIQRLGEAYASMYQSVVDKELQQALVHIEGSIPSDEDLQAHGYLIENRSATPHPEYEYQWKGKTILRISSPRVIDGKLKYGVSRLYQKGCD